MNKNYLFELFLFAKMGFDCGFYAKLFYNVYFVKLGFDLKYYANLIWVTLTLMTEVLKS